MRKRSKTPIVTEPIGIVISRGNRDDVAPMFWAYVWGPAPEGTVEGTEAQAA